MLATLLCAAAIAYGAEVKPGCGAAGDVVLVSGASLPEAPSITIGGVTAEIIKSDSTRALCRVPEGTAAGDVELLVEGESLAFHVLPEGAPVVLHQSASTLVAGQPLFVVGRRLGGGEAAFVDGDGVTQATATLKGRDRAAVVTVPDTLAEGHYTVVITNADGLDTGACSPGIDVVVAGVATLDAISPDGALVGERLELTGSDLSPIGPCRVVWTPQGGGEALRVPGFSNGYDRVVSHVPLRAEFGTAYDVSIDLRGDAVTNALAYATGNPGLPFVSGISPGAGPAGSVVEIEGSDLLVLGAWPEVTLGSERLPILFVKPGRHGGDDLIVVGIPHGTVEGTYDLVVTVGGVASNAVPFTVEATVLGVTRMSPDSQGTDGPFFPVAIEGSGFGWWGQGDLDVVWDDGSGAAPREGKVIVRSDTLLLVRVPGGRRDPLPAGSYEVRVERNGATAVAGTYTVE